MGVGVDRHRGGAAQARARLEGGPEERASDPAPDPITFPPPPIRSPFSAPCSRLPYALALATLATFLPAPPGTPLDYSTALYSSTPPTHSHSTPNDEQPWQTRNSSSSALDVPSRSTPTGV